MLKIRYLYAVVAIAAAPFTAAEELSETGEFLDGVAAIVNEGVVLKSQLNEQVATITQRAQEQGIQLPPPGDTTIHTGRRSSTRIPWFSTSRSCPPG